MLNGKQIREVTAQGIKYVDENNVEQFIDFAQCVEDYQYEWLNPDDWEANKQKYTDWEKLVQRIKRSKEVGWRDIGSPHKKPRIVFRTRPRIGFEFDTEDEWYDTLETLKIGKYRTFDMT